MICHNKILNSKSEILNKPPNPKFKVLRILFILILGLVVHLSFDICHLSFAEQFGFVVFGDTRDDNEVFRTLIQKVNQEKNIAFAVNIGDFVYNGKRAGYVAYQKRIQDLNCKVYNVMGNHDAVDKGWLYFNEFFGPDYYSFDYDNSHFIVLDNAFGESFGKDQFSWLKRGLKDNQDKNLFVFMHRPVFDPAEIIEGYLMSPKQIAEELEALFTRYKVRYVFAGHIHTYARAQREGVVYIVTGGGGSPLHLPEPFGGYYHYVRMDVNDDKITDKVVRIYE